MLVTFQGVERQYPAGLLALEPLVEASGFAIGVETAAQQPVVSNAMANFAFVLKEELPPSTCRRASAKNTYSEDVMPNFVLTVTVNDISRYMNKNLKAQKDKHMIIYNH